MILFNITILADEGIHEELKYWILKNFFPTVSTSNFFKSQSLLKVLNSPNEGITYSLQFIAENESIIDLFRKSHLISLHDQIQKKFTNKVYLIESLMEFQ